MLSHAIGGLLPSAIGVALSPIPIIAVIVMLGTPRARSNGIAFASGWIAGLVVVSVVVLVVAHGAGTPDSSSSDGVRWGTLVVGVLFLVMAAGQLRKRPKRGETPQVPKWMATIDHFNAVKSALFGAVLSGANPKNLALSATAAAAIAQQGLSAGNDVIAIVALVVIGSLTVVGPVALFLLAAERAARLLETIKEFMSDHNAVIMFVVLLVLGLKLIGSGISG